MQTIKNFTLADLKRHYNTFYEPNNATIVVVGDFNSDVMIARIKDSFGGIPAGPPAPHETVPELEQKGERRVYLKKEAQLPTIYIMYHVPTLTDPDSFALDVMETVLAGGKSSRLYKSLVYDKQIAQYAGCGNDSVSRYPDTFTFWAGVMPDHEAAEVESGIYDEIERMKAEPVDKHEFQKAKNQIEASFIMGQDSNFYRAMLLGRYETVASWKYLKDYLAGIRAVTPDDVMRVAKKYFTQENRTVGILQPLPITEPQAPSGMPGMGGVLH